MWYKIYNRNDANYLPTALREANYREKFTSALSQYVNMGK